MTFDEWVKSLPAKHWAKYDLAAVKLGWDAAHLEKHQEFRDQVAFVVNHMPMSDEAYKALIIAIEKVDK